MPSGESQYAEYFGWTSTGEYYIGADFHDKVVFCFLEENFSGTIKEFNRQTDYYAENVPEEVLDAIGREVLFQVFPTPDGKRYIFIKLAEPPFTEYVPWYEIWLWDAEKQEASILLDANDNLWRMGLDLFPPEEIRWLENDLLFVNCETGDEPNYFYIDIRKKEIQSVNDGECYWNEFFRGYIFSPDGKRHLSVDLGGDIASYSVNSLLIAQTKDALQYYRLCTETGDRYAGLNNFMQQTEQIPFLANTVFLFNGQHPTVHWPSGSDFLYLVDINSDHVTYGDILKYNLNNRTTEIVVEFERLEKDFSEIKIWYEFTISPSEEYILIVYPWNKFHILPIADLQ